MFDGRRLEIEQLDRRLHRLRNRCEEYQPEPFLRWQRDDLQFGGKDGGQSSFASREDFGQVVWRAREPLECITDRKSTRLNSSHLGISYAVFCLKKKKTQTKDDNHIIGT